MPARANDRYSILNPGNLLIIQERERLLRKVLQGLGITSLEGKRVFEAGCAGGYQLRLMVQWGALPGDIAGIDLDLASVEYCLSRAPSMRVHCGDANSIPEPDGAFDLALAFTLFSSVPKEETAAGVAAELVRIVKPGGAILIYDMRRRSPSNPAVHPISRADVRRRFPRAAIRQHHLTLAPPIARAVGRYAPFLYGPLAALPLLRTHSLFVVRLPR